MSARNVQVQCPNCRNTVGAIVRSIVDPQEDPEGKLQLLSNTLNVTRCPNCGAPITLSSPILYHDHTKELLVSYVPMELNMPRDQADRTVGALLKELTARVPKDQIKGYFFQPKQALTMQGLIEMVLAADGVTKEMLEEQRERARLAEQMIQASDEELAALVQQHDAQLDAQFFQTMTMMAQRFAQEGRTDLAGHILQTQQEALALSTFGKTLIEERRLQEQVVAEVAQDVQALGESGGVTREAFLDMAIRYGGDDQRLQALVGLARPAFDQQFFSDLATRTSLAPKSQRYLYEELRDKLMKLTAVIDQQAQQALQQAASFLRALLSSPNPDQLLAANMDMLDDTFMAVLQANLQEAEKTGDAAIQQRLQDVYQRVVNALRQTMQPELRFLNDLLSLPDDEQAKAEMVRGARNFGPQMIEMIDAVHHILSERGESRLLSRLTMLREAAVNALR